LYVIEPLDADDLGALSNVQKSAVIDALFLVVAIDRQITPIELAKFNAEIRRVHWRVGDEMLMLMVDKARMRVKSTLNPDAWRAWVKEIAQLVIGETMREKLVRTMIELKLSISAEINERERSLINAFIVEFQLAPIAVRELASEFRGKFHASHN
jgi:hypothetical protein